MDRRRGMHWTHVPRQGRFEWVGPTPHREGPMRLEIRDFRLVVAISELGNLTRAGQHLNLTQSALSHQLADLEQRVGGKLFERSGRRLIPTRLGEHLSSKAKVTLEQLREVERDLENMAKGREATLRIT